VHLTCSGECSWHEFTVAIMARAQIVVPIEPVSTVTAAGGVDRPLNGVLARPHADELGVGELQHWEDALTDYMDRAGLAGYAAAVTN
jgi:dTDP-4-dehydrorhamnose reductase